MRRLGETMRRRRSPRTPSIKNITPSWPRNLDYTLVHALLSHFHLASSLELRVFHGFLIRSSLYLSLYFVFLIHLSAAASPTRNASVAGNDLSASCSYILFFSLTAPISFLQRSTLLGLIPSPSNTQLPGESKSFYQSSFNEPTE